MTVGCWNLHVGVVICVVVERRWCPGTGVGAGGAVCPLKLAYGGEGGIGVMGEVVCAHFCYLHLVVGFHYSWVSDILA